MRGACKLQYCSRTAKCNFPAQSMVPSTNLIAIVIFHCSMKNAIFFSNFTSFFSQIELLSGRHTMRCYNRWPEGPIQNNIPQWTFLQKVPMFTLCVDKMKETQKIEYSVKKLNVWTCAMIYYGLWYISSNKRNYLRLRFTKRKYTEQLNTPTLVKYVKTWNRKQTLW